MDFYGINTKSTITADSTPDLGETGAGNGFGTLYGEATSAQWGDLAEKYKSKVAYDPGTVVCVSPDPEFDVEQSCCDLCTCVVGVVSTKPGFTMNNQVEEGQYIALTGLVPVKVIGPIKKSDFIVPAAEGYARAGKPDEIAYKMGVCNESNDSADVKLVKCIIK